MRLIEAKSLQLKEFFDDIPKYAILSHTWGDDEVTLQQWTVPEVRRRKGFAKIEGCCRQAEEDGIDYVWVDTNCIDKTSSSELSEAINSMFAWYRDAEVCFVFLGDVSVSSHSNESHGSNSTSNALLRQTSIQESFRKSRWFKRGWTLQELLAPTKLVFYSQEWRQIGTKEQDWALMSEITGIDRDYLRRPQRVHFASVARRMSWMSQRETTRVEDIAYCMLGIFDINMPLLYGEGIKAFRRLQEEIIKESHDQTIFCWKAGTHDRGKVPHDWVSILAPHPAAFAESGNCFPGPSTGGLSNIDPYTVTNHGLRISVPLLYTSMGACAVLDVGLRHRARDPFTRILVRLHAVPEATNCRYVRLLDDLLVTAVPPSLLSKSTKIFVDCRNTRSRGVEGLIHSRRSYPPISLKYCAKKVLLLVFSTAVELERTPVDSAGMEFHFLDSAVEIVRDSPAERSGIILRGRAGGRAVEFELFVGAMEKATGGVGWSVRFRSEDMADQDDSSSTLSHNGPTLPLMLENVSEESLGSWHARRRLVKGITGWLYSEDGAMVYYLDMDDIHVSRELQFPTEDARFECLRRLDLEIDGEEDKWSDTGPCATTPV